METSEEELLWHEQVKISAAIDEQIEKDLQKSKSEVRILLLGAQDSGKNTLMKTLMLHQSNPAELTQDEREYYRHLIWKITLQAIQALIRRLREASGSLADPSLQGVVEEVERLQATEDFQLTPEIAAKIKSLWGDGSLKACFQDSSKILLHRTSDYYLNNIDRLAVADYLPTQEDVFNSLQKNNGISEIKIKSGDITLNILIIDYIRGERKKWIHFFEGVQAVLYCASLSEYDQSLELDEDLNRMQEALTFFDSICNSRWFQSTSILLFLTKADLFRQKIAHVPLTTCFPDYKGGPVYEEALGFIMDKFKERNRSPSKVIYPHVTDLTDPEQLRFIMDAVTTTLLSDRLTAVTLQPE